MTEVKVQRSNTQIKLIFEEDGSTEFPIARLMEELGLEMKSFATSAGLILMQKLMEAEVEHLAGPRKSRGSEINRWCKENGSVVVGGQRLPVERQRLRTDDNKTEVPLKSYTMFHGSDERTQAVYQRMLAGVSCRNYQKTLEEMAEASGVSKSVVSREIIRATEADIDELCKRDLSKLDVCVMVVDGMPLDGQMTIAAIGVETSGKKHFLGFHEGATENSEVCESLFKDFTGRGLDMQRPMLYIIDGAKALVKAIKNVSGVNAVIQRCQFHKSENLRKHLPKKYQAQYETKLRTIYEMRRHDEAKKALESLITEVDRLSVSAGNSLREGFDETLTLHLLEIPDILRKSFSTSNIIESTFSVAEDLMKNVKRWRTAMQRFRWCATAFLRTEKKFRRVRGYKSMQVLVAALEAEVRKRKNESLTRIA